VTTRSLVATNRPERDGRPAVAPHLSFQTVLELANDCWIDAIRSAADGAFDDVHLVVGRVRAEYGRELHEVATEFDVRVARIGSSSLTVDVAVRQNGVVAAEVSADLVAVDPVGRGSVRLTAAQHAVLERLVAD
jgi:acyl-CoA thioesterase FadM